MRLVVTLMCLGLLSVSGVARAQTSPSVAPDSQWEQPSAPPPTPPPPPPSVSPRAYDGPAESPSERAWRYSRFSSGQGGLLLIFTELISGLTTGGLYGNSLDTTNGTYLGAVIGGLTLGTAAAIYQYYVPVERNESLLAAGGAALGFLAGFGAAYEQGATPQQRALTSLLTTQLGIVAVMAATYGPGDVSEGDAGLVGMTALYAFVVTGLTQAAVHLSNKDSTLNLTPTFIAPAIGMALGGLLAIPFELAPRRVFRLTVVPLAVGAVMLGAGALLANGPAVPLSALGGVAATFVITLLATANDQPTPYPPSRVGRRDWRSVGSNTVQAIPVPVVMRSGVRGESLTAGPGMLLRF